MWGTIPGKVVLTEDKLPAWMEDIDPSVLEPTFLDAIDFTYRLWIHYKDSHADWEKESAAMSLVYKSSYCNLSATAASNDQGGCYVSRDPDLALPLPIYFGTNGEDVSLEASRSCLVIALDEPDAYPLTGDFEIRSEFQPWLRDVMLAPTGRRAWIVQEVIPDFVSLNVIFPGGYSSL